MRKSVAIKVAEVSLKFTGFFVVKFHEVGGFCIRKNDKKVIKKQSRPRFTRRINLKFFGFVIKNAIVNLKRAS